MAKYEQTKIPRQLLFTLPCRKRVTRRLNATKTNRVNQLLESCVYCYPLLMLVALIEQKSKQTNKQQQQKTPET